jgi:hypothetical protein
LTVLPALPALPLLLLLPGASFNCALFFLAAEVLGFFSNNVGIAAWSSDVMCGHFRFSIVKVVISGEEKEDKEDEEGSKEGEDTDAEEEAEAEAEEEEAQEEAQEEAPEVLAAAASMWDFHAACHSAKSWLCGLPTPQCLPLSSV